MVKIIVFQHCHTVACTGSCRFVTFLNYLLCSALVEKVLMARFLCDEFDGEVLGKWCFNLEGFKLPSKSSWSERWNAKGGVRLLIAEQSRLDFWLFSSNSKEIKSHNLRLHHGNSMFSLNRVIHLHQQINFLFICLCKQDHFSIWLC